MAGMTKAQLEARLLEIEAENARLRASLEAPAPAPVPATEPALPATATAPAPRHRGRAFLGITLIVLGALLAPLATVVGFAARQVSETEVFVRTLAPLAEDPAVQQLIVDEATLAIDAALDTDALVAELLDSVVDQDATPRLAEASEVLGPLLADQARVAIRNALTLVVESEAFATVWEEALRLTHAQVVAVLEADADGAVAIDDSGTVSVQLAPIIAELKPALVDAGFTLADSIPEVTASITVAELPGVATARLGYEVLTTLASVLAWLALGLLIAGILVHPRRGRALVVAGTLLLVIGALIGGAIALGGAVTAALIATEVPTSATDAIYGALTGEITAAMLAFAVLGAILILAGIAAGRSPAARTARAAASSTLTRASTRLDARGWRPEGASTLLQRAGWLLWVWLGLVLLVLMATLRPLSVADVVVGSLLLALAAAVFGVLRADPAPQPVDDPVVLDTPEDVRT